jgi:hypothetical protein
VSTSSGHLPPSKAPAGPLLTQAQLAREVRRRLTALLYDDSGVAPEGVAVYTLSDPRDLRTVRYVGQSSAPRRRFLQHIGAARLWLPDETPWWIRSPKLRPLYCWIREIFQDEERLPAMVVRAWVAAAQARLAERTYICECLTREQPLVNFEVELLRRQPLLL